MIVAYGHNASERAAIKPDIRWKKYNDIFFYSLSAVEHFYEDERYILLADISLDKSSTQEFDQGVRQLLDCHTTGIKDYELFLGSYFLILFDKATEELSCFRDPSGIKTGYYHRDANGMCVGNLVHDIASMSQVTEFDEEALHQLMSTFYINDGFTFYKGVRELKIGTQLTLDKELTEIRRNTFDIELAVGDNDNSFEENTALLRDEITRALHKHSCRDNVVLLSGGIDSVVMLAALDELGDSAEVRAVSYRVTGTDQDETVYARDIADHLGRAIAVKDADPDDREIYERFEDTILKMNNPYYGVWIFGDLAGASLTNKFFAGQDTRLHTPDMSFFDRSAYAVFSLRKHRVLNLLLGGVDVLAGPVKALDLNNHPRRIIKGIGRLFELFDTQGYLLKFVFKCDRKKFKKMGLPTSNIDQIEKLFHVDIDRVRNRRELYNEVTKVRWKAQFINNIRYLDDLARLNQTYLAVPFYDARLARVSSGLPLKQAIKVKVGQAMYSQKKALIDKYMLRMAFEDKLTEKTFNRQKAVSMTLHLLIESELGRKITDILTDDLKADESFLKKYGFEQYVGRFLEATKWGTTDFKYLYNITYLAAFCVYDRRVLGNNLGDTNASAAETPEYDQVGAGASVKPARRRSFE